jgi:hypothetical protein
MHNQSAAHDHSILAIIEFIKQIEVERQLLTDQQNRKRIGFKQNLIFLFYIHLTVKSPSDYINLIKTLPGFDIIEFGLCHSNDPQLSY